jgi:CheY-like chemotaxis protein
MPETTNSHTTGRPTILLVEEDDDLRPQLSRSLRKRGYRLLVAADLEDARDWVSGEGHIYADLVLMNLIRRTPEEVVRLGRELRDDAGYDGRTPLVVVPEKVPRELEGRDVNVSGNDWVCYFDDDSDQLQALLSRLLENSAS